MNMVRAVLSEKEVPKSFWPDAVQWANLVLNRSLTTIVKDMTPEEAGVVASHRLSILESLEASDTFMFPTSNEPNLMTRA